MARKTRKKKKPRVTVVRLTAAASTLPQLTPEFMRLTLEDLDRRGAAQGEPLFRNTTPGRIQSSCNNDPTSREV